MPKLRSDSTMSRLTPDQLAEVDDMLISGAGYADVRKYLSIIGVTCSQTAIAEYYHTHVLPRQWARRQGLAAQLAAMPGEGLDEATLSAVKQAALDLALTPGSDPRMIRTLYDLVIRAQALDHDARKLALLETKAAAADAAKDAINDTALTTEEKAARIQEIFGLA